MRAGKSQSPTHTFEAKRAAPPSWVALGPSTPGFTFSFFAWYLFDPFWLGSAAELTADKHIRKHSQLNPFTKGSDTHVPKREGARAGGAGPHLPVVANHNTGPAAFKASSS